ncbi:MAG TPA: serine/threonine-protein kinase [Lacipirellulaceae bacterium]|jgi:serine/threonine-protein kinase|nr:serine/threonine-protein kinase [Lacipirellulaceae bacterium]
MSDLVGKKLKDFFVLRRLGRGAMAEVYLAQQLSLGRQVALKVLNSELARDPNYVRRFDHEARAAAALVHGNIVQIYEVGQQDGIHYIAQEYVPGRNLGEVIRSSGSLEPQLALDIIRQVTAALAKASSEGIVHRDIKPENIMLARSGEVKVADFGLARVQGDGGANLTQVGVTMGTPLYMSPEQIEGRSLDSRSDIYSLGVTAYHMLAGQPPFTGDSPLSVAVQHLNQPATSLSTHRPNLPAKLAQLIERMMAKSPADRFNDPAGLLVDVHALATEGAQQGWATTPDHASLTQILWAADQRSAATTRLDDLMRTTGLVQPKRHGYRWFVAAIIGCALAGAALSAAFAPRSLWAGAKLGPPKRDTVWGQLYQAKEVDTETAWQAVLDYFPDASTYAHNLAKQGLAYHYLHNQEYKKAIKPLQELSAQPDFQAFGIAGLVVAFANLGDDQRAYQENQRLSTEMRAALDQRSHSMSDLLKDAIDELADRAL